MKFDEKLVECLNHILADWRKLLWLKLSAPLWRRPTFHYHALAIRPVNWKPGDKVIVPPPKTEKDVKERLASNYERLDFYLCKKSL